MLALRGVHYQYHQELFTFDYVAEQGDIVSLMGPSGAGKSTLLALVAGFIEPTQGDIIVARTASDKEADETHSGGVSLVGLEAYQRPLAMLFQEHNLFAHLTVRENIGLGLHPGLKLTKDQKQRVVDAAEQVGVSDYLDRLPEQLSGGQKQRVALARCFVQPHDIWLLDEPFSALDPLLREDMLALVKRLAEERNITVLMVTHHIGDARSIANKFAFVAKGQILATGYIDELTKDHHEPILSEFVRAGE